MAKVTGGGIQSRVNKEVPIRTGSAAKVVNPGGSDQLGQALGAMRDGNNHILNKAHTTPLYGGNLAGPGSTPLGNSLVNNVGSGGPGAGRTLYGQSGSQGMQGPPAPGNPPGRRDILSEFGPEISGPGRKR
jgi:hypothetical protein